MTLRAVSVDFASKWNELGDVCFKVIRCDNVPNDRWHRSFSDVYSLCVSRPDPHGPRLYEAVTALLRDRITEILNELSSIGNSVLLDGYVRHWDVFHRGLEALDNLFKFVNNQYVRPKRPAEPDMCYGEVVPTVEKHNMEILQLGLSLWKTHLIEPLQCRLTACLLKEISNDRLGIVSQQHCIVPCLESFLRIDELKGLTKVAPNVYFHLFESPLVEETRTCYTTWAARAMASASCTEYVSEALKFLNEETNRAMKYYKDSRAHLVSLFNEIVVQQHLDFLNASVVQFVKEENRGVLKNFYQLLAPTNHCSELLKCFGSHVKDVVNEIIAGIPNDQSLAAVYFVDALLSTKSRFTVFIDDVFDGMSTYRNEMDKAFGQAINSSAHSTPQKSSVLSPSSVSSGRNPVRSAEYLSRYMDILLRRSSKQYTEAELESKIAASIDLFKYVEEKDIFRQYYQRNLCYRLLFGSSTLLELEESTINQLNAVCGYEFTSKFQRMFNDIQLADGMNTNFQNYLRDKNLSFPFAHHCHVLTVSAWPINLKNDFQFCLPADLLAFSAQFEAFYTSTFNGRNLHWALSHCTAEVRMFCADKPYTLFLAALNAATLLLFDKMDVDELTTKNLALALLPDVSGALSPAEREEILRRAVMPLLDAGILLLTSDKQLQITPFSDDVTVRINRNYTNRHTKVKVASVPQTLKNASAEEVEQVQKKVDEDRRYFTQAAIVRIMKSRKTCNHTMLVKDVIDMAKGRFKPPISLIKRCIEVLIEKGYLERNPSDTDEYNYLA